jgi:hypothetical protein
MTEDAIVSHLTSLNYLVATQFNGSGGSKNIRIRRLVEGNHYSSLSDFRCNVFPSNIHGDNAFILDRFVAHLSEIGLRLFSHLKCG